MLNLHFFSNRKLLTLTTFFIFTSFIGIDNVFATLSDVIYINVRGEHVLVNWESVDTLFKRGYLVDCVGSDPYRGGCPTNNNWQIVLEP